MNRISNIKLFVILYTISFFLAALIFIIDPYDLNHPKWKQVIFYIILFLIVLAASLHLFDGLKKIWTSKVSKWIFAILLGYIGLYTDSQSHFLVYKYVKENPDNFSTAINFLDSVHIYPNLLIFILSSILVLSMLSIIIIFIQFFIKSEIIDIGLTYLISSMFLSLFLFAFYIGNYQEVNKFISRVDKKLILLSSYYPNTSCNNPELKHKYIKLIGVNGKVSYSNITITELANNTPMDFVLNMLYFDKKIQFNTTSCKRHLN